MGYGNNLHLCYIGWLLNLGFDMVDCSTVPPFYTLITVVLNCVKLSATNLARIPAVLTEIQRLYPEVKVTIE